MPLMRIVNYNPMPSMTTVTSKKLLFLKSTNDWPIMKDDADNGNDDIEINYSKQIIFVHNFEIELFL